MRSFRDLFGINAAARGRAPGRVNLIGDHTDYNDGLVLPTVIPQQTVVELAVGAGEHQAYSTTLDRITAFGSGEMSDFGRYVGGCVRVLEQRGIEVPPLRIRIASDVPVGAGLSSSAALEVAMLRGLDDLLGLNLAPETVASLAHQAETQFAGVPCGIMDQMVCALGQTGRMMFLDTMMHEYRLLPLPAGAELLVVHSGWSRALAASAYGLRRAECAEAAARLGVKSLRFIEDTAAIERLPSPLRERARHVVTENARVVAALGADATDFGRLMNQSHASLRDDYAVCTPALDRLVDTMQRQPEIYGARLTGAGFGGCCVALVQSGAAMAVGNRLAQESLAKRPTVVVPVSDCQ